MVDFVACVDVDVDCVAVYADGYVVGAGPQVAPVAVIFGCPVGGVDFVCGDEVGDGVQSLAKPAKR